MNIEIDNYYELLALHKTMMAVKFDENSCLREAQGSPFTASLAFKVFDCLVTQSLDEGKQKQAQGWLDWQVADKSRTETELLLQHISESVWWEEAAQDHKEKYVRDFMAPLVLSAEVFNEITRNC